MLQLLSSIPIPLKVKPELENVVLKLTAKTMAMRIFPLSVDNLEGNILKFWMNKKREKLTKRRKWEHFVEDNG